MIGDTKEERERDSSKSDAIQNCVEKRKLSVWEDWKVKGVRHMTGQTVIESKKGRGSSLSQASHDAQPPGLKTRPNKASSNEVRKTFDA